MLFTMLGLRKTGTPGDLKAGMIIDAVLSAVIILLALSACSPKPDLCDRSSVTWDKYGTPEIPPECGPRPAGGAPSVPDGPSVPVPPSEPPVPPSEPPVPPSEPPAPEPKPKGNNGFGNGSGDGVPGKSGKTDEDR